MIKWAFSFEASLWVNALALVTSLICVVFFLFVLAIIWVSGNYAAAVATVAGTMIIAWGIAYREYKRSRHYAEDRGGEGRCREDQSPWVIRDYRWNETEPEREPDNRTDNPDNRLDGEREET